MRLHLIYTTAEHPTMKFSAVVTVSGWDRTKERLDQWAARFAAEYHKSAVLESFTILNWKE